MKQTIGEVPVLVWVPGRPRTKGHMKPDHIRTGVGTCAVKLRETNPQSTAWKKIMTTVIKGSCACERYDGAVIVDSMFLFEPENGEDRKGVADGSRPWPTSIRYGDRDTLERNVMDALTQSGLILDDKLVVDGRATKRWAVAGEQAGVWIRVRPA